MASFGHSGRQAPQLIHSSVISSAMILASLFSKIEQGAARPLYPILARYPQEISSWKYTHDHITESAMNMAAKLSDSRFQWINRIRMLHLHKRPCQCGRSKGEFSGKRSGIAPR